jgi:hypothetical protein
MSTLSRLPTGNGDQESTFWGYRRTGFWQDVDDAIGSPDMDWSYIVSYAPSAFRYMLFTFTGFSVPAGSTITNLIITSYSRAGGGEATLEKGAIKVGGTRYYATEQTIAASENYSYYTFTWTQNPATSATWTVDQINGSGTYALQQIGVAVQDTANEAVNTYVTQIYGTVTYTEGSTAFAIGGAGAGGGEMSLGFAFGAA